jgi:hypothetical protein
VRLILENLLPHATPQRTQRFKIWHTRIKPGLGFIMILAFAFREFRGVVASLRETDFLKIYIFTLRRNERNERQEIIGRGK